MDANHKKTLCRIQAKSLTESVFFEGPPPRSGTCVQKRCFRGWGAENAEGVGRRDARLRVLVCLLMRWLCNPRLLQQAAENNASEQRNPNCRQLSNGSWAASSMPRLRRFRIQRGISCMYEGRGLMELVARLVLVFHQ